MDVFSDAIAHDDPDTIEEQHPLTDFENTSDTLIIDEVALRLDLQLDDDDLEVSLLIESLESQYRDMLNDPDTDPEKFVSLQSAKEWARSHKEKLADLFRYLKLLTND